MDDELTPSRSSPPRTRRAWSRAPSRGAAGRPSSRICSGSTGRRPRRRPWSIGPRRTCADTTSRRRPARLVREARKQFVGGALTVAIGIAIGASVLLGSGFAVLQIPTGVLLVGPLFLARGWARWRLYWRGPSAVSADLARATRGRPGPTRLAGAVSRRSGVGRACAPDFWARKFAGNVRRDGEKIAALRETGWDVLVVWECETKDRDKLRQAPQALMKEDDKEATGQSGQGL